MKKFAASLVAALVISACASAPSAPATAPLSSRFADPVAVDTAYPPSLSELSFESHGKRLNGHMYLANGAGPHPTVILLHGFPGNEKNLDLAQALRREGFNVLFFHYRGAWGSEGDFSFTNVIEDVWAAADFLTIEADKYRVDKGKLIPIGHSMGGFAAIMAAANDSRFACTAGLDPADFGLLGTALAADSPMAAGFAEYSDTLSMLNGFTGAGAVSELTANAEAFSLTARAPQLAGKTVLIVGAQDNDPRSRDEMVKPLMDAYAADEAINATTVMLPGDHSFSWTREALINTVADWAEGCR